MEYHLILKDIKGREDVVTRLKEKILDIIIGMRPWYNTMHRINLTYVSLGVFCIILAALFLSLFIWVSLKFNQKFKWNPDLDFSEENIDLFGSLGIPLNIAMWIFYLAFLFGNKLRNFFFPPTVFMIGQEESRFKRKERFQWVVIIGFGVSLAAGLVVSTIMLIF